MGQEIIFKKRFLNKYLKLLSYLKDEFGDVAVARSNKQLKRRIQILKIFPESGQPTVFENVRSFTLGGRNVVFYRIEEQRLVIINMFDLKKHPLKNPFQGR